MPFPIIAALIAVVVSIIGGAVVINWDSIVISMKGKRVGIIGARGVGKTHLAHFLSTGSIPEKYSQTLISEKTQPRRFRLEDLNLCIQQSLDVSGDKSAYAEWKALFYSSDVFFYLLRADKILISDYITEKRVREDIKHLSDWINDRKNNMPVIFIIGTHCDNDPNYTKLQDDKMGDYRDAFRRLPVMLELFSQAGGVDRIKFALGSMKDLSSTEKLVHQIFSQVN